MLSFQAFFDGLEDDEEDGDDEEEGDGADDHATDGADTEGVVAVGSDTSGESQGQEAEDHRERGHEDGTQADGCSIEGSLDNTHTLTATRRSVLGKQDGGLRQQTDQHDESRLHIDVILKAPELSEDKRTCQSEGYTQDDGQRNEEALVKGAENQIDEDDAKDEDQCGGVLG